MLTKNFLFNARISFTTPFIDEVSKIIATPKCNVPSNKIMQQYIILWNWTDAGVRNLKNPSNRGEGHREIVEKNGGKLLSFFYTIGQFDGVVVLEAPDDEALMKIALGMSISGNFRTTTLRALGLAEGSKVISHL